jgi:hypothetical protein
MHAVSARSPRPSLIQVPSTVAHRKGDLQSLDDLERSLAGSQYRQSREPRPWSTTVLGLNGIPAFDADRCLVQSLGQRLGLGGWV